MTVANDLARAGPYIGDDVATEFAFSFRILEDEHIQVIQSADGVDTTLSLGSDYTVSGVGSASGSVILAAPLPTGETLTIIRSVPLTQTVDLQNQGGFFPDTVERMADLLTMAVQQQAERLNRAVLVSASDEPSNLVIPNTAGRANKALVFDADGDLAVSADDYEDQAAAAAASASAASASATAASGSATAAAASATAASGSAAAASAAATSASESASVAVSAKFETLADLGAAAVSASVQSVRVDAYSTAGDGGGALYARVASEPPHTGKAQSADGAWWEIVNDATVNVRMFGASSAGDSSPAIAAMAALYGYVRFPAGSTRIGANIIIDVPIYFDPGAHIETALAVTTTITNSITSPVQHIFRGAGSYVLGHDSDSGENARMVHASWFGAFPNPNPGADQAPAINRGFAAMGNGRENVMLFDIGNYNVSSQIAVTRGGHVKGSGTRRTVFKANNDGYDLFVTSNVACRFSGIQFEVHAASVAKRTNAWIRADHLQTDIFDVNLGNSDKGIVLNAIAGRVQKIGASYTVAPAAGSSLVEINGENCFVDDVEILTTSAHGPTAIVHSRAPAAEIGRINHICPSISVLVDASVRDAGRNRINGVRSNSFTGAAPRAAVRLVTSGTYSISGCIIDGVAVNGFPTAGIEIEQGSSGVTEGVVIDGVAVLGASGTGMQFTRTAGTLRGITVGAAVDVSARVTPYGYSGSLSDIQISPTAIPGANPAVCYDLGDIPDDGVATINLQRSVFSGFVIVTSGYQHYGLFAVRAASSPQVTLISRSANMEQVNTALTGTTGVDGKITFGVQSGVLYVENRLGAVARTQVSILTGIA